MPNRRGYRYVLQFQWANVRSYPNNWEMESESNDATLRQRDLDSPRDHWPGGGCVVRLLDYGTAEQPFDPPILLRHKYGASFPQYYPYLTDEQLYAGCQPPEPPMPPTPPVPTTATSIPTANLNTGLRMANVSVKRDPTNSRLYLYVEAKHLHEILDSLGVTHTGNRYDNRPNASYEVCNSTFQLSTEVFLRREYPSKYDLTSVFSTPPSLTNLKRMCNSAFEAIRKILEHYQPIDISVEIQKKVIG